MKSARFPDHWRHVDGNTFPNRLDELEVGNIPGVGTGVIEFRGGIHAICGQNGSGKSTLLNCIAALVSVDNLKMPSEFRTKVNSGTISARLHLRNSELSINLDMSTGFENHAGVLEDFLFIDVPRNIPSILNLLRGTQNLSELLDSLEPRVMSESDRAIFSYVAGRKYDEIKVFEIEEFFERETVPYFEVRSRGISYSSLHMGLGEFSIFYILWALIRTKKTSIVLLEEPESFISPQSQQSLVNFFAKMSDEHKLWILISTHSEHILEVIPERHISVLRPRVSGDSVHKIQVQEEYFDLLGLSPRKRAIVFLEDAAATMFLRMIISQLDGSLIKICDFVPLEGEGNVLSLLKLLPTDGLTAKFAGVLDGDRRGKADVDGCNHPILYLPGDYAPESVLLQSARDSANELSNLLGRSEVVVTDAVRDVEALDIHDQIPALAGMLAHTYDQLMFALFQVWISDGAHHDSAKELTADLRKIARGR